MAPASGQADGEAAPIFGIEIPPGYRDWRLISVAHEEGNLNDLRAILGNDIAIKAYREGKLPFPGGTIIARLAWDYVSSEENNKAFGRVLRRRGTQERGPVHGQGLKKIRLDRRLGGSPTSTSASPPAKRCTMPAFPVTRSPRLATLCSTVTHLDWRRPGVTVCDCLTNFSGIEFMRI